MYVQAVRRKIQATIGEYDELLTVVKKRKLGWFGHVSRSPDLAKTILQGIMKGKKGEADRRRGGETIKSVDRNGLCQLNKGH